MASALTSFVREASSKNHDFRICLACTHGAVLVHLHGFGLGAELQLENISGRENAAKFFTKHRIPCEIVRHPNGECDHRKC
jgi:hypothetical protein